VRTVDISNHSLSDDGSFMPSLERCSDYVQLRLEKYNGYLLRSVIKRLVSKVMETVKRGLLETFRHSLDIPILKQDEEKILVTPLSPIMLFNPIVAVRSSQFGPN